MFIPDCVQRSAVIGFYGNVSDGDDVSAMREAILHRLRLQEVNSLLRGGDSC